MVNGVASSNGLVDTKGAVYSSTDTAPVFSSDQGPWGKTVGTAYLVYADSEESIVCSLYRYIYITFEFNL